MPREVIEQDICGVFTNFMSTSEMRVVISPNPASETVTITYPKVARKSTVVIFDIVGREQKLYELPANSERISLLAAELESGFYMCSWNVNGVTQSVCPLVLQR